MPLEEGGAFVNTPFLLKNKKREKDSTGISKSSPSPLFSDSVFTNLPYFVKFICNPKTNTHDTFLVIRRQAQSGDKSESSACTFPAEVKQGDALPSGFSSYCEQVSGLRSI